jgi:hypothetical protein
MLDQVENQLGPDEESEFDFYLMWEWPEHIETALRRMLWISLVETAEGDLEQKHTNYLRWLIATHPDSPPAVLEYLCNVDCEDLLVRIAENPQTSAPTLSRLALSEYDSVRIAVSDNENTPIHVIKALTKDPSVDLRYNMAENPALPAILLAELSADENVYVAVRAAKTMARRNPASVEHIRRNTKSDRKLG